MVYVFIDDVIFEDIPSCFAPPSCLAPKVRRCQLKPIQVQTFRGQIITRLLLLYTKLVSEEQDSLLVQWYTNFCY